MPATIDVEMKFHLVLVCAAAAAGVASGREEFNRNHMLDFKTDLKFNLESPTSFRREFIRHEVSGAPIAFLSNFLSVKIQFET